MISSYCYHGGCVDVEFVKSSFCPAGACVEVGVGYKKSSHSGNGGCVEVGARDTEDDIVVLVRDSKNPDKPPHEFNRREWDAFLKGVKAGEFDLDGGEGGDG